MVDDEKRFRETTKKILTKKGFDTILADSIEYSPMFWIGMFTKGIKDVQKKCIKDVMSPSPISIDGGSNLMEAAYLMLHKNERRLLVTLVDKIVGVIREQDLFFAMENILNS
ncbi:MAG: CBS domain-containing protein [Desulfobacula sp.]|nr:CBS domain-containing protein [Desulfobacula sp.]